MVSLKNIWLSMRFARRVGAFKRARRRGMSKEQAYAYSDRLYPSTADDLAYQEERRFKHLIGEIGREAATPVTATNILQERGSALEEFAGWMATRQELASVLEAHGYLPSQGKAKMLELYHDLRAIGAGQWVGKTHVPTVALFDPHLLNQLLHIERSGKASRERMQRMGIAALDYVEAKDRKA